MLSLHGHFRDKLPSFFKYQKVLWTVKDLLALYLMPIQNLKIQQIFSIFSLLKLQPHYKD